MEAVTNVDHAVAAALSSRHHPHSPSASTTSTRKLRVQAAILMPVRQALKNLHESQDCRWQGQPHCGIHSMLDCEASCSLCRSCAGFRSSFKQMHSDYITKACEVVCVASKYSV